jgi:drug/metabolite transporter (DMT)-like permease
MRGAVPYLMLTGAALFWAGNFVTARALGDAWTPLTLNAARWLVASAVLAPFTWASLRAHAGTLARHAPWLLSLSLTGVVGFQTLLYLALQATTVVNAAIIAATTPLVVALGARIAFGEPFPRLQALGTALSLAGALVVVARGDPAALASVRLGGGELWMLVAVPCWAVYSLLLMRGPRQLPQVTVVSATSLVGVPLTLGLAAIDLTLGAEVRVSAPSLAGAAYIGVFAGALAFVFWSRGIAAIGPSRASLFLHLMPLFAALLGVTFLAEPLAGYHALGAALVVSGVALASRRGGRRPGGGR